MLYVSGIILSFFLSFLLTTKKNKSQADIILAVWLGMIGLHLLSFHVFYTEIYMDYPDFAVAGLSLPLVHGPLLYLYTWKQTTSKRFRFKLLLHFLPVIMSALLFASFYFLPLEQKTEILRLKGAGYEWQDRINHYAIYASGVIYCGLSLHRLLRYRKNMVQQFSNTEKINFNWLLYLIGWMVLIWFVILFIGGDQWIFACVVFFVFWLGYFGIKQVQVFNQHTPALQLDMTSSSMADHIDESNEGDAKSDTDDDSPGAKDDVDYVKYQKSPLSEQEAIDIHKKLRQLLIDEKPYKNPDLTLNELATSLNIHPNYLSQVINSRESKNFYDLVNEKRVEEFKKLIAEPFSKQYTLLTIAFECGFNSKASFNRNFKKYTGISPSDYLKTRLSA